MFNNKLKKVAMQETEEAVKIYDIAFENMIKKITELYDDKWLGVEILKEVEKYVELLANKPYEIEKRIEETNCRRKTFEKEVQKLEKESEKYEKYSRCAAGAGMASFGPTAILAVLTNFGPMASAGLAGTAATNATLAWVFGGSVAAGGSALIPTILTLSGPVGWTLGGALLVGSGILNSSKNKKIAEKAEEQTKEIKNATDKVRRNKKKAEAEIEVLLPLLRGVKVTLKELKELNKVDYNLFTIEEKDKLICLVNSSEALSKRIEDKLVQ
ncbi:MAG: hypothetical protein UDQ92_08020 [Lachnospiraceae bacterium]|nr:hypothetical protein [Lachnospiraceae bacterium]